MACARNGKTSTSAAKGKRPVKRSFLPGYFNSLDAVSQKRYVEKLKDISGEDPYESSKDGWKDDVELWPSVTYIHVGMYLLFSSSGYTKEQLMNYKSLDSYEKFTNGWVREVHVKVYGENRLVIGKVNHSQRISEKPLTPWIIAECKGKITAAHCDCMAGLGESCSHVASLLWAIEAGVKHRDSLTVTDKGAYWVLPTTVKSVTYAKVKDIKFVKGKTSTKTSATTSAAFSKTEVDNFLSSLKGGNVQPAILSLVDPYSDNFVPESLDENLPKIISNTSALSYEIDDLTSLITTARAKLAEYNVTTSQQETVEKKTRGQSKSRLWYRFRTGRVTASKFYSVCHSDPSNPSHSLIMSICYPELSKFKTNATIWGLRNESKARGRYADMQSSQHQNFTIWDCGLIINIEHGFMAASPDGLVECSCCGEGLCEIKCPYKHKDTAVRQIKEKGFCLEETNDGFRLRHDHPYYYQVQAQLFCSKRLYCDFVVYTNVSVFVERLYPDNNFWEINLMKAEEFVVKGIMPEILGTWFSRPCKTVEKSNNSS